MANVTPSGPASNAQDYQNSPLFQALEPNVRSTLSQALSLDQLNALFTIPQVNLAAPQNISAADYFGTIAQETQNLRIQLNTAEQTDSTEESIRRSRAAANQAIELGKLFDQRDRIVDTVNADIQTIHGFQDGVTNQNTFINQVNNGNVNEKSEANKIITAYNNLINTIASIGGSISGNTITIPPGVTQAQINEYNAKVLALQTAISTFNTYWNSRSSQINSYNTAANTYNTQSVQNNRTIQGFITNYGLPPNLLPLVPAPTGTRNISGFIFAPNPIPQTITGAGQYQGRTSVDSWIPPIAQSGPPILPSLPPYTVDFTTLRTTMTANKTQAINNALSSALIVFGNLNALNTFLPRVQPDDRFALAKPLIRDLFTDPAGGIYRPSVASGTGMLSAQVLLGSPHLEAILGKALYLKVLNQVDLQLNDQAREKLANRFLLLSTSFVGNNALQSLFAGLSPLTSYIPNLPLNSPSISLFFALSFVNRALESIANGSIKEGVKAFVQSTPELNKMNDEQIQELTEVSHVVVLVVAGKMLLDNLGKSGLAPSLLTPLASPTNLDSAVQAAKAEDAQTNAQIRTQVQTNFIQRGFNEQESAYLGAFASDFVSAGGLLAPSVTAVSSNSVQRDILTRSITSGLVLSKVALDKARQVAEDAVNKSLGEGPYLSVKPFTEALEGSLRQLGIQRSIASDVAGKAILIPREEAQGDVITSVQERTAQLLVPQLGAETAQTASQDVARSLFGTPNDKTYLQSALSVSRVLKDEVQKLNARRDAAYADSLHDLFKNSLKGSFELSAFLEKLMDPANLFVYSASSGIIYSEPTSWKKPTDVPV